MGDETTDIAGIEIPSSNPAFLMVVGAHVRLGLACVIAGLLLIELDVGNGKRLPIWKELPRVAYWLLPAAIGIPLIVRALLRHPPLRQPEPE